MEEEENQGSLFLGILLGFFLNCLGIVIALVMRGSKTLTGSIIGVVLQMLLWSCTALAFGIAYPLLMQATS